MTGTAYDARVRPILATLPLLLLAACSSGRKAAPRETPRAGATAADVADRRDVGVRELTKKDLADFEESWRLFLSHDPRWPAARDRWLERGGGAPYVLSENLFRYFWSASKFMRMDEIARVGETAKEVGEPAVAYFAKALVTDRWPLKEPVTVEVPDSEKPGMSVKRTFDHYEVDDTTRQHAARVLAMIGDPAIPTLAHAALNSPIRSSRVYGAYALGSIGTDRAIEPVARVLATSPDWQTRGAAAKALGFALRRNPAARPPLEKARSDPDAFVRKKAEEALAGKTRLEF